MNWFQSLMVRMFGDQDPITPVPPANVPVNVSWPTSNPVVVAAATAWMEDDKGGKDGMQAVLNVIVNRKNNPRWWGTTIYGVCMKPYQFSCWNAGSTGIPRFEAMLKKPDENWQIALNLAELATQGLLPDITKNSDSYYSKGYPYPASWPAQDTVAFNGNIGGNFYYRLYLSAPGV